MISVSKPYQALSIVTEPIVNIRDLLLGEPSYAIWTAIFAIGAALFWHRSATRGLENDTKGSLQANAAAALWAASGGFLIGASFFANSPNVFGPAQDYIALLAEAFMFYSAIWACHASYKSIFPASTVHHQGLISGRRTNDHSR
jgi:hypothetical protein